MVIYIVPILNLFFNKLKTSKPVVFFLAILWLAKHLLIHTLSNTLNKLKEIYPNKPGPVSCGHECDLLGVQDRLNFIFLRI